MAASVGRGSRRGITAINITPMVDIILVLLVIFMVTSTTMSATEAVAVDKPDAATGQPTDPQRATLVVTCDPSGTIYSGHAQATGLPALREAARRARANDRDVQALVSCDGAATIETLVDVLDALRAEGIHRYAIATDPEPPEVD